MSAKLVRKQEAGNRKQETGNRKQEAGNRKQETGNRKQGFALIIITSELKTLYPII